MDRAEKIAAALGSIKVVGSQSILSDYARLVTEEVIRQRINELLDELGLVFSYCRISSGEFDLTIEDKSGMIMLDWCWFPDSDLPEKEQDLLIWLVDRLAEKGERERDV